MRTEELKQKIKREVDSMGDGDYLFMCQMMTLIKKHKERAAEQ